MQNVGINFGYLLAQLCSVSLVLIWLVLVVIALLTLRRAALPPVAKAIWALLVVSVPVLGAVAFLIVRPDREPPLDRGAK